jgi:hypothetical protein
MFERIAKELQPKPASTKWEGLYLGRNQKDLANIKEGQELVALFFQNMQKFRKAPVGPKKVSLVAVNVVNGQGLYVDAEIVQSDGFSVDKPIDLLMEVEQGPDRTAESKEADPSEGINPAATQGQLLLNVRKTIESIIRNGESGIEAMFETIDRAYDVAQRGGISAVIDQELAANAADVAAQEALKKKK